MPEFGYAYEHAARLPGGCSHRLKNLGESKKILIQFYFKSIIGT
jgi:hypothetical protein